MAVYLIHRKNTDEYKIGLSQNPKRRLKSLQTANAEKLKIVCVCNNPKGDDVLEQYLHRKYYEHKRSGEWFVFTNEMIEKVKEDFENGKCELYKNTLPIGRSTSFNVRQVPWGQQHSIASSRKTVFDRKSPFSYTNNKRIQPPVR